MEIDTLWPMDGACTDGGDPRPVTQRLGEHLTAPGPGGWTWWKDAVLRSAGFPVEGLRALSCPGLGRLADEANRAESRLREEIASAEALLRDRIAALRAEGADAHRDELRALGRSQKFLKALRDTGRADEYPWGLDAPVAAALRSAAACRDKSIQDLQQAFPTALAALKDATRTWAGDPAFRSAVGWQNIGAVQTALNALCAGEPMSGSKRKQRETLVASYVQRYCAKNDTIGFFGPMAWIRIDEGVESSLFKAGPALVRSRTAHYEDWAIDAYAARLAADDRYMAWLVAHLQPFLRIDESTLRLPGGRSMPLGQRACRVLAACNSVRTAKEIARAILVDPFAPFASEDEVYAELRALERERRIRLAFPVPSCRDDPDLALRHQLARIDDTSLRAAALAGLDALISAKSDVHAAAGDPTLLDAALQRLHHCFADIVGGPHRRRHGEVYGGRALVYEDCHRDVSFAMSTNALRPATEALELVMTSARWFTVAACSRFVEAFEGQFDLMCNEHGQTTVHLPDFWLRAQSIIFGDQVPLDDLAHELRDRWEGILLSGADHGQRRVDLDLRAVRDRVESAFPLHGSAWKLSRYQCPDLMFCAKDPEHLLRGEYLAVLGEVHVGGNTVATNLFASQHPDRRRLLQSLRSDLGVPYAMPKLSPEASGTPTRTQWVDDADAAIELLFSSGLIAANAHTAIAIADLDVAREHGGLVVRHKERDWEIPLVDALGDFLFLAVINRFGMLHKRARTPRVTVGRLVVQRETWSFDSEALAFAVNEDECELFKAARSWKQDQRLPDHAFVKMSWEAKPMYVDFNSIVSLRMLAKQVRGALNPARGLPGRLTFSEVLPDFDELWLRDSTGRRFTSELRLVAVYGDDALAASTAV